jgi:transcriptional regulator
MYIPTLNLTTDTGEMISFMREFSFATIITAKDHFPVATHLPFLVPPVDEKVILTSHFAKANNQWKDIVDHPVLVIFSQPHAYISPSHYDSELNVPTWNYMSVHAYGQGTLITDQTQTLEILEKTIDNFESAYRPQWEKLPEAYKSAMIKGIVAFEIVVTDLQGKKKLSQNKKETEKQKIIETLSKSKDTNEQNIANYMERDQKNKIK